MTHVDRPTAGRYRDRFVRETAQRIYFLLALSARFDEPARLMEELRQALCSCRGRAAGF